jgi:4-hydroxybenzoate polyprenyltransferase
MWHRFFSFFTSIYLLEIVGASAVTAFGWVVCRRLSVPWIPSGLLWFSGYLLVYNLDRLHPDPSDRINTPTRIAWSRRLRRYRIVLVGLSAGCILIWPLVTHRPWLISALLAAVLALQFYSRAMPGFGLRIKDLPYLKSFIAPTVIAGALVIWPTLEAGQPFSFDFYLVLSWSFLMLTTNGLLFDYRDIKGDLGVGVRTVPALLGKEGSVALFRILAGILLILTICCFAGRWDWLLMPSAVFAVNALLLWALNRVRTPLQLSFGADFLLFVPAIVEAIQRVSRS